MIELFTTHAQCIAAVRKTFTNRAGAGRAQKYTKRLNSPCPMIRRASHVGVAIRMTGGNTTIRMVCWIMCMKYRRCSAMSCSGQSVAT